MFTVSGKKPDSLGIDDCVLFPLCFGTCGSQLLVKNKLRLGLAHDTQLKLLLHGVELALNLELVLCIYIQVNLPSAKEISRKSRASLVHR